MAAAQRKKDEHKRDEQVRALTLNGREEYAWRVVDSVRTMVVVKRQWTIPGNDQEHFDTFQTRMLLLAHKLTEEFEHTVVSLKFHRRTAQGKRHWAEFNCRTAAYDLPHVEGEDETKTGDETEE